MSGNAENAISGIADEWGRAGGLLSAFVAAEVDLRVVPCQISLQSAAELEVDL